MIADAHCHFFSARFFDALGRELPGDGNHAVDLPRRLGWDPPGENGALAKRWLEEFDRHGVVRALLIASVPGDEASVAAAVAEAPNRVYGAFMINPAAPDAASRAERAFDELRLSTACLFPAMHHAPVDDSRTLAIFDAASRHRRAVFVHCGALSVGARKRLGLSSRFDVRLGDPLAVAAVAVRYPDVPVIIPHFGAGLFTQALMAASLAPNIVFDTSSSNSWIRFHAGLTLRQVFERALDVAGPSRLLFGTDSSFFPRGWHRGIYEQQLALLTEIGVTDQERAAVLSGNFERIFGER
jgi:predicted TIM-barrel fold metal-dependent hydrolase